MIRYTTEINPSKIKYNNHFIIFIITFVIIVRKDTKTFLFYTNTKQLVLRIIAMQQHIPTCPTTLTPDLPTSTSYSFTFHFQLVTFLYSLSLKLNILICQNFLYTTHQFTHDSEILQNFIKSFYI